jgi:hypothetical protein
MTVNDWWPSALAHIPKERPWDGTRVTVAVVLATGSRNQESHRSVITVLGEAEELEAVNIWVK